MYRHGSEPKEWITGIGCKCTWIFAMYSRQQLLPASCMVCCAGLHCYTTARAPRVRGSAAFVYTVAGRIQKAFQGIEGMPSRASAVEHRDDGCGYHHKKGTAYIPSSYFQQRRDVPHWCHRPIAKAPLKTSREWPPYTVVKPLDMTQQSGITDI